MLAEGCSGSRGSGESGGSGGWRSRGCEGGGSSPSGCEGGGSSPSGFVVDTSWLLMGAIAVAVAAKRLAQFPSFPRRQLTQDFLAFTPAQPLQEPVRLAQFPSFPERQLTQDFLAFTQAQPLQESVLLHLQHAILPIQCKGRFYAIKLLNQCGITNSRKTSPYKAPFYHL